MPQLNSTPTAMWSHSQSSWSWEHRQDPQPLCQQAWLDRAWILKWGWSWEETLFWGTVLKSYQRAYWHWFWVFNGREFKTCWPGNDWVRRRWLCHCWLSTKENSCRETWFEPWPFRQKHRINRRKWICFSCWSPFEGLDECLKPKARYYELIAKYNKIRKWVNSVVKHYENRRWSYQSPKRYSWNELRFVDGRNFMR